MTKTLILLFFIYLNIIIVSCSLSYLPRAIYYNIPSIQDYKIFPEREIKNAPTAHTFLKDTTKFNLTKLDNNFSDKYEISNHTSFEGFLKAAETTAFIILKNDTIIYEKYYNNYFRNSINTSFSTSKSITSALIGIALDEGYIEDINDPLTKYLPKLEGKANADITIKSLITMTSGIAYDDESRLFGDDAKSYYSPDLREYALEFSIENMPGQKFKYNNINPLLIGMILESSTGRTVSKYLEEKIWKPLKMEFSASWSLDENGFEKMESGINARAIDFLKFGYLYLNKGNFLNQQIISEKYINLSVNSEMHDPVLKNLYRGEISYGYYWWIFNRYLEQDDFYAEGNLGQFIYVSPVTKTVIIRHGKEYGYNRWPEFFYKLCNELSNRPLSDNPFEMELKKSGLQRAINFADSLREDNPSERLSEYYLNLKGYHFLNKDQINKAIEVFKLNVRSYPQSFNVYDSLGEAYLKNKQTKLAKINYQKSLELNPANSNASGILNSLKN